MPTDRPPAKTALLQEFRRSDQLDALDVPLDDRLVATAQAIETAMASGGKPSGQPPVSEFLNKASDSYKVCSSPVHILASKGRANASG